MSVWEKIEKAEEKLIPVDKLIKSKLNPRKDLGNIEELKESIRSQGLIYPLVVRPKGDVYEIVDGFRRFEAIKKLAEEDSRFRLVRCKVVELSDKEAAIVIAVVNRFHKTLKQEEEAECIRMLREDFNMSEEEIAKTLAMSVDEVVKLLSIVSALRSIGKELITKGGRWRQVVAEEKLKEKAVVKEPEVKARSKPVVEAKPRVAKIKVKEKEEEKERLAELERKVPLSIASMVWGLVNSLVDRGAVDRSEEKRFLIRLLEEVCEHAYRQQEVQELCKMIRREAASIQKLDISALEAILEKFRKERYSKVEVKIKIDRWLYDKLADDARKKRINISELIEKILESYYFPVAAAK